MCRLRNTIISDRDILVKCMVKLLYIVIIDCAHIILFALSFYDLSKVKHWNFDLLTSFDNLYKALWPFSICPPLLLFRFPYVLESVSHHYKLLIFVLKAGISLLGGFLVICLLFWRYWFKL